MGIVPVAFSLMASFMSAVTLLGVSAEIYNFGTMFVVINLAYGIFTPVAAYLYLPVFFNLGATSVYEVCMVAQKSAKLFRQINTSPCCSS